MTQDDIIRMAREAGMTTMAHDSRIAHFAALVAAAEREKVAHWVRSMSYATGHGDTIEEMLDHLGTQIAEGLEVEVLMEREACARVCDDKAKETFSGQCQVWGDYFARVIRARSKT